MKKSYRIDVDCANCANKMEDAAKHTAGVKDASVNFMKNIATIIIRNKIKHPLAKHAYRRARVVG